MVRRLLKLLLLLPKLLLLLLKLLLLLLKLHPLRLLLKLHPLLLKLLLLQSKELALQATKKPTQVGFFYFHHFDLSGDLTPGESLLLRRHRYPVRFTPQHIA